MFYLGFSQHPVWFSKSACNKFTFYGIYFYGLWQKHSHMSTIPIPCRIVPSSQKFPAKCSKTNNNKITHQVFYQIPRICIWSSCQVELLLALDRPHCWQWIYYSGNTIKCVHISMLLSLIPTQYMSPLWQKKLQGFQMSFRSLKTPQFCLNLHFEP